MKYDNFDHKAFFADPEPEPNFAFSDDDPEVTLPPDLVHEDDVQPDASTLSDFAWHTRDREVLDEVNDLVKNYIGGVTIAILDTGENPHEILPRPLAMESFIPGQSPFDGNSHGTHVAGTAAGKDPRYTMIVGANHITVKVLSNQGSGSSSGIASGANYAIDWKGSDGLQVDIMNFSLGGSQRYEPTIRNIKRGAELGVLTNAAAGNSGPGRNTEGWPAKHPDIASIGNFMENGQIANSSSRGNILLACPGTRIWSASNRDRTQVIQMTGTSMACPNACNMDAGLIALRRASGLPRWRDNQPVFDLKKQYTVDRGSPGYDTSFGNGVIDLRRLIRDMARLGTKIFQQ